MKKGISPLIASVILIAFTLMIAFLISWWISPKKIEQWLIVDSGNKPWYGNVSLYEGSTLLSFFEFNTENWLRNCSLTNDCYNYICIEDATEGRKYRIELCCIDEEKIQKEFVADENINYTIKVELTQWYIAPINATKEWVDEYFDADCTLDSRDSFASWWKCV